MRSAIVISATTALLVVGASFPAHALFGGALPASKCSAGKLQCIAAAKSCLLECHRKAISRGTTVDPTCLTRCRDDFAHDPTVPDRGCFAKAEAHGDCGLDVGDTATVAAAIEADIAEILRTLVPAGGTPTNPCTAKKAQCVEKYDKCILTLARKAAKAGTPVGDVSRCLHYLDGTSESCASKLEARYLTAGSPCLTSSDQATLRIEDDAFIDDVLIEVASGPNDVNTERCSGNTSVKCASAPGGMAGCGGPLGTCEFFVGAPQPLPLRPFALCAIDQWNGPLAGTFDESTGASVGTASILSRVYSAAVLDQPCPICDGDPYRNDGVAGGTCVGGARNGLPCDGNGTSPEPSFGTTSLDCPPLSGALIATSVLDLPTRNDGDLTKTVSVASPTCNGAPGKLCVCASCSLNSSIACASDADCASASAGTCSSTAGEARKPSACVDDTLTPIDGTVCVPTGGNHGVCADGPFDLRCAVETFRNCLVKSDCPAPNDYCNSYPRSCFPGYAGNVGDTITATGSHGDPRNGAAAMTFAALACEAPTPSSAVNAIVGLPGPVRYQVIGVGDGDGGPGCPTHVSFVPTAKGPAFDTGWTGYDLDQKVVGESKVTVATSCTGTHPNCACTYTGPIPNPDAH